MLVRTEGIVLRQIPFSDTSVIVKLFTREFGLVSLMIKGAKSSKNPKANLVKPINQISVSFLKRNQPGLIQPKEIQLLFAPDAKNFGIFKSSIAMFMVELIDHTIQVEAHEDMIKYDFIHSSFQWLIHQPLSPNFYLSFMIQYATILGIDLMNLPYLENLSDFKVAQSCSYSREDRKKIYHQIASHFQMNIQNFKPLKSIEILEEILS